MPNRPRPRCPECDSAMLPVFRQRPRGETFERIPEVFHCPDHDTMARGRKNPAFLPSSRRQRRA